MQNKNATLIKRKKIGLTYIHILVELHLNESSTSFPGFSLTRPTEHSVGQVGQNPGNKVDESLLH